VIVKGHPDSPRPIDAAVAAVIAYHRASWHAGEGKPAEMGPLWWDDDDRPRAPVDEIGGRPGVTERLLDAAEAAELLNVPAGWPLEQARAGNIPHVRLGRDVRFSWPALVAWARGARAGRRACVSEAPAEG
jgi:excisionase family DNA binding protein